MTYTPPSGDNVELTLLTGYTAPSGDSVDLVIDLGGNMYKQIILESFGLQDFASVATRMLIRELVSNFDVNIGNVLVKIGETYSVVDKSTLNPVASLGDVVSLSDSKSTIIRFNLSVLFNAVDILISSTFLRESDSFSCSDSVNSVIYHLIRVVLSDSITTSDVRSAMSDIVRIDSTKLSDVFNNVIRVLIKEIVSYLELYKNIPNKNNVDVVDYRDSTLLSTHRNAIDKVVANDGVSKNGSFNYLEAFSAVDISYRSIRKQFIDDLSAVEKSIKRMIDVIYSDDIGLSDQQKKEFMTKFTSLINVVEDGFKNINKADFESITVEDVTRPGVAILRLMQELVVLNDLVSKNKSVLFSDSFVIDDVLTQVVNLFRGFIRLLSPVLYRNVIDVDISNEIVLLSEVENRIYVGTTPFVEDVVVYSPIRNVYNIRVVKFYRIN